MDDWFPRLSKKAEQRTNVEVGLLTATRMKDIVATAIDNAQRANDESSSSETEEFGLPRFCYIGCGSWGCQRVAAGIASRNYDRPPSTPFQQLTTRICIADEEAISHVRTAEQFGHETARASTSGEQDGRCTQLATAIGETDICLLTLSLTDADAVTTAVSLAREIAEMPVLVFAVTDGQHAETALQRLTTAANTTLLFDESVIFDGPLGLTTTPVGELSARLVREFVTDAIEMPTISGPIGTQYPRVASHWDTGGITIPSIARVNPAASTASTLRETLLPLARTSAETEAWVGYVVAGEQFTLEEFEQLRTAIQSTVGEHATDGVLAGRIHPSMDNTRHLTLLQMVGKQSS